MMPCSPSWIAPRLLDNHALHDLSLRLTRSQRRRRTSSPEMIHAYHVIGGTYGFWLPNDPRGSWSDFVASWELARFGKTTRSPERVTLDAAQWARWRAEAEQALLYPSVVLTGTEAQAV